MAGARTLGVALRGIDGTLVEVEADVAPGLPGFTVVGMPDSSMLQARDRVRAATAQVGAPLASRRITVNLCPAWLPKTGSGFDLPMAIAVLSAQRLLPEAAVREVLHLGELGLDGTVRPVPGVLPALRAARDAGVRRAVVPAANSAEAYLVSGLQVDAVTHLADVLRVHGVDVPLHPAELEPPGIGAQGSAEAAAATGEVSDFADVIGQQEARHAAEVSAAGGHHLLLTGPPGAGKTMIASRLPGILPDLDDEDALTVSTIASVTGRFDARVGLVRTAPFEAPHHTASVAAVVGGGSGTARPGAITRAHAGVLFLDEAPEFSSAVLESLREPLETGDISLHRAKGATRFPARFQLVLAANPCPCGKNWGKGEGCTCTPLQKRRYLARLSGPVLDRIDLRVTVTPAPTARSEGAAAPESTAAVRERVLTARERAAHRFRDEPFRLNARIPAPLLREKYTSPDAGLLETAVRRGSLTLRGHDRVLRLAWTLADLDNAPRPTAEHIGTALTLRQDDRS